MGNPQHKPRKPVPHGTVSGYSYHGCRCDECRAARAAKTKEYNDQNRDKVREASKAYYHANREDQLAKRAENYRRNIERERAYHHRYAQEHMARKVENVARWRREHPEEFHAWQAKNRERRKAGQWTKEAREWWDSLVDPLCSYCGAPATVANHVIPVSEGGNGSKANMAPACTHCNNTKQQMGFGEFMRRRLLREKESNGNHVNE